MDMKTKLEHLGLIIDHISSLQNYIAEEESQLDAEERSLINASLNSAISRCSMLITIDTEQRTGLPFECSRKLSPGERAKPFLMRVK